MEECWIMAQVITNELRNSSLRINFLSLGQIQDSKYSSQIPCELTSNPIIKLIICSQFLE